MKVLYVSRSKSGKPHPFIKEQADFLEKNFHIEVQHFLILQGGIKGYVKAILQLKDFIKKNEADIIHVHYGLWAFVVVLSKLLSLSKHKIIITFHGSDINKISERQLSLFASRFVSYNILVSPKMIRHFKNNFSVIPCGVDTAIAQWDKEAIRKEHGWTSDDFVILFSSSFDRKVKDPEFAFKVVEAFSRSTTRPVKFIELKGYTRDQLTGIMQAADVLILCSISEGSPQVIKESILNSLPIVANDVGDIEAICAGVDNCFIIEKDVQEYVRSLHTIAESKARINNRGLVLEQFDNNRISKQVYDIYSKVLKLPA